MKSRKKSKQFHNNGKTRRQRKHNKKEKEVENEKQIAGHLQTISQEQIEKEFKQLREINCKQAKEAGSRTRLGNRIVDAFTLVERLHSTGDQKVTFYDFWKKRDFYQKKPYIKKMLAFYKKRNVSEIRKMKYIFSLYFSSISIFRPIMAMEVYCRVHAKRVLDFTMGWGGRLVGACSLNLEAYYGVDLNKHLAKPYKELIDFLQSQPDMNTTISVQFKNALEVDYSRMDYDTVFTSPPYYNTEIYHGHVPPYSTKAQWHKKFYEPLFRKTYTHLKKGGNYCINVPETIYNQACIPTLGNCDRKIMLKKGDRGLSSHYREFIYVWEKK